MSLVHPTRRELLAWSAAGAGALAFPRPARASLSAADRRFLFVYCRGGWDPTRVFLPTFDFPDLEDEPGAALGQAGNLPFVDHPSRQSVARFLSLYGERTVFFNGFEVRSVAHERCEQLLLTGVPDPGTDDWPALLAGNSREDLLLPCLVASGPTFTSQHTASVVRLGETGQLSRLLDGAALADADMPVAPPSDPVRALLAEHAAARTGAWAAQAPDSWTAHLAARQADALQDLADLDALAGEVDLSVDPSREFLKKAKPILDGLELGLTRCGSILHLGVNETGWDSHAVNDRHQSEHQSLLFGDLLMLMDALDRRVGPVTGGALSDEVTVVVMSEMGRSPWYNVLDGKDHWTWTSAMLVGGGVTGDRVVGGVDGALVGLPVDLSTGEPSPSGTLLSAAHFGASLLALGDVDPGSVLPGIQPVRLA